MKKIHYLSGLFISVFVALHLTNHLAAIGGAEAHINTMQILRPFYRNPVVETLLLMAVVVQIISGIKLWRVARKKSTSFFHQLHIWSGLYMAVFFLIHVGAVMAGRWVLHLDTNFYFGVAGLNYFPSNLFFIPYYVLAILSFFAHVASVHQKKMKHPVLGLSASKQAVCILMLGALVTLAIFYGLTNHFTGVKIPAEYEVLIGK
jgi:hypothetical protein